jgi:hypothetical protein
VRYTFPQTLEDFKAARRLILARQTWVRPTIVGLVVLGVALVLYPLFGGNPPPLRVFILNTAPWAIVIALWIAMLTGYTRSMQIALGLFVLLTVFALVGMGRPASVGTVFVSLLPYALYFGLLAFMPYMTARLFRSSPIFQGDTTVELMPEELRIVRETSTSTYRWNSIVRAVETPEYFLIFIMNVGAHYIPKRVIPPGDLDGFRAFLRAHVPSGLL